MVRLNNWSNNGIDESFETLSYSILPLFKFAAPGRRDLLEAYQNISQTFLSIVYWAKIFLFYKGNVRSRRIITSRLSISWSYFLLKLLLRQTLVIRTYYKSPFAAVFRFSSLLAVFIFRGMVVFIPTKWPRAMQWPMNNKKTSAIFFF